MNKSYRLIAFFVLLLGGLLLSACNAQGLEFSTNPDGTARVEFRGPVEAIAANQWTVAGQALIVNGQTVIDGAFKVGDTVKVNATVNKDASVTANKIEAAVAAQNVPPQATPQPGLEQGLVNRAISEMTGKVDAISAEAWVVSGITFKVNAQTELKDQVAVGNVAKVHYVKNDDGSFTAIEIELAGNNQASNSNNDNGNKNGQNPGEVDFIGIVESISANAWTVGGKTFAITAQTEIKGALAVGDKAKVHAFLDAASVLTAREVEPALATNLTSAEDLHLTGVVEKIAADQWLIGGQVILITPQTMIKDVVALGDKVRVEVFVNPDGSLTAKEIENFSERETGDDNGQHTPEAQGTDDHGGNDDNSGGDDNGNDDNSGHGDDDNSGSGKP